MGQVTGNQCVIKTCRSRSKRCSFCFKLDKLKFIFESWSLEQYISYGETCMSAMEPRPGDNFVFVIYM